MNLSDICWKLVVWPALMKMANIKGICQNYKRIRTTPFPYITLQPGLTFPTSTTVATTTTFAPITTTIIPPITTTFVPLPTTLTTGFPTFPTFPSSLPPFPTLSSIPTFPTFLSSLPTTVNPNCATVPPTCPPPLTRMTNLDYTEIIKTIQRSNKRRKRQILPNGCPCIDARNVVLDFIINAVRRGDIDLNWEEGG